MIKLHCVAIWRKWIKALPWRWTIVIMIRRRTIGNIYEAFPAVILFIRQRFSLIFICEDRNNFWSIIKIHDKELLFNFYYSLYSCHQITQYIRTKMCTQNDPFSWWGISTPILWWERKGVNLEALWHLFNDWASEITWIRIFEDFFYCFIQSHLSPIISRVMS